MAKKENVASVLAFEKKLVPSDGFMYGTAWESRDSFADSLVLREKSVRGTISNRLKKASDGDPTKLNAAVEKPNLQRVDACALEPTNDTLKLNFTLKVLSGVEMPSACNNTAFKQSYAQAAKQYISEHGFRELARRYAMNIASGRALWRNRVGVEQLEVMVNARDGTNERSWVFDGLSYSLRSFDAESDDLSNLSSLVAEALCGKIPYLILDITCYAKLGKAQEVYPSEELVLDKGKGNKGKILYSYGSERNAAMHSQKIGNALRTIDTWYPAFSDPEESAGPIAVEPYGAVTNLGCAYRPPKEKQDFYSLFDRWARGAEDLDENQLHYVMATLVRGGVFGESDK